MKKCIIYIILLLCSLFKLSADESIKVSLDFVNYFTDQVCYYNEINPVFSLEMPFLTAAADLSFINDSKYQADIANFSDGTLLGYYTIMNNGYLEFNYDNFLFSVGQQEHSDFIDSEYSLFISGKNNPGFIADFIYDGDFFYYETRWIRLNERSAQYKDDGESIDRGANYKTYALKLGDFRLGLQDAAVYLDRSFDLEYFVNPMPQYIIQYNKIGDGRPWQTTSNENNLIGAFLDYTTEDLYVYAQYLMDDFNLHWLLPDTPHNPNKMAYAVGSKINTDYGKFTFDVALAFKYTFEATYTKEGYSDYPYEYTYYPLSTFFYGEEEGIINYLDNYIGYKYGENNLAIRADYSNIFNFILNIPVEYDVGTEFIISGSKSPSNPWHELSMHTNTGTKLFDEDILEYTIKSNFGCYAEIGNFSISTGLILGYVFNELVLSEVVTDEAKIFIPKEGNNRIIIDFSIGLGYSVNF